VLQCCSLLQCVAVCFYNAMPPSDIVMSSLVGSIISRVTQCVAVQCIVVCCGVLQRCSVLQCVAVFLYNTPSLSDTVMSSLLRCVV